MARDTRTTGGSSTHGDGSAVARTAGFAAAKGAGLIAVAVIVGVLLLQIVDDGSTGPIGNAGDASAATTTTAKKPASDKTTTTLDLTMAPAKTADQVRVLVLNGGAAAGSAGTLSEALKAKGYTNQEPANDDTAKRSGNVVHCRAGLEREASALAVAVGDGTPVEPFPDPAPAHSAAADCVVITGA